MTNEKMLLVTFFVANATAGLLRGANASISNAEPGATSPAEINLFKGEIATNLELTEVGLITTTAVKNSPEVKSHPSKPHLQLLPSSSPSSPSGSTSYRHYHHHLLSFVSS